MKTVLTILFAIISMCCQAQCYDVYGSSSDCPTKEDSLVIYNNAFSVYQFYENNKDYIKTRSTEVVTKNDKKEVFESLQLARRMFNIIRKELASIKEKESKFAAGKPKDGYEDITYSQYYQIVDDYRFYQRELESQIINANAPMSIYDSRICPIMVNEYKCIDTSSVYYGDLVNLPLYIPVVVKPFTLLTAAELNLRNEILHIIPKVIKTDTISPLKATVAEIKKADTLPRKMVKREYVIKENNEYVKGYPVYAAYQYGGGALIGFLINGKFRKIKPSEYIQYAVPPYARQLLENDLELNKMLQIKFGVYYRGLL
jgi:hypothetical protein